MFAIHLNIDSVFINKTILAEQLSREKKEILSESVNFIFIASSKTCRYGMQSDGVGGTSIIIAMKSQLSK